MTNGQLRRMTKDDVERRVREILDGTCSVHAPDMLSVSVETMLADIKGLDLDGVATRISSDPHLYVHINKDNLSDETLTIAGLTNLLWHKMRH